MIPLKTVNDLINKHALLEKELSSTEIDKNSFGLVSLLDGLFLGS